MNVIVLTQYYKPEMGAPQNRLYEMVQGLILNGANVTVVTSLPNYPRGDIFPEYKGKFYCLENPDGVDIHRYWLYASNSKNKFSRFLNMLSFSGTSLFSFSKLKKKNIDIIIVESPPLTLGLTAYMLSRLLRAKLVVNISDLWPLSAKELGAMSENSIAYKLLEKLERFLYKKAELCLGQSAEITEYIKQKGAKRVYLFRNGVDPSRFNSLSVPKSSPEKTLKIIYAGLLGFAQGIYDVCKNVDFKSLNAEFHIYGAGGEQKIIEDWLFVNKDSNIYFHGSVTREEIPIVLSKADVTLVPLVTNIFGAVPSKIYEAMAAGLPILFSGEGEGARIVSENDIGWVSSSKDYTGLANNIEQIVLHPEYTVVKRNNCLHCANEKFNRPKQIKDLFCCLESILVQ